MTARSDAPDTPGRTDAIARIIDPACYGPTASPGTGRRSPTSRQIVARDIARVILATDDPAAVAAIADQWAEHHPDTLHRPVHIWQERPGEFSYACWCGTHWKHQRFGDWPQCGEVTE